MTDELLKSLEIADNKIKEKKQRTKRVEKIKPARKLTKKETKLQELARETVLPSHYKTIWTEDDLRELCNWLKTQDMIAVDTETMGLHAFLHEIVGISFYAPHQGYYIPLKHIDDILSNPLMLPEVFRLTGKSYMEDLTVGEHYIQCLPRNMVTAALKPLLEDRRKKFLFHNSKFDMHVFHNWMNIDIKPYYDTLAGAALLDENQSKKLKDQANIYLKIPSSTFSQLFGRTLFNRVPILLDSKTRTGSLASFYAIKDTELTYKLYEFQMKHLNMSGMEAIKRILFDIEIPMIDILFEAEQKGIKFDSKYMKEEVEPVLVKEVEKLRQKIWNYTGEINLRSPAQVAEALFVKLKLPANMGKKARSTDKKTLKKMKGIHEVTDFLLDFRSNSKLVDSFVTALPNQIIDGRLHPNFNSVGAVTLRMSCSKPNLQQVPSRVGNLIRNAFIADEGRLLASVDFSGQEVRVLAHVSRCPVLLDIFEHDKDFHAMTGTGIYNKIYGENVTYEYFQYCRGLQDLFLDKDGNIDLSKIDNADELFALGKIPHTDKKLLETEVKKGKAFEKIRKNYAKTVNC